MNEIVAEKTAIDIPTCRYCGEKGSKLMKGPDFVWFGNRFYIAVPKKGRPTTPQEIGFWLGEQYYCTNKNCGNHRLAEIKLEIMKEDGFI